MIDRDGFRPNVGIVISNHERKLFWARRVGRNAWQFPQGGIHDDETVEQALFRELNEEVGLEQSKVEVLGKTKDWYKYRLPEQYQRQNQRPLCIGQKQQWYLLRFHGDDSDIKLTAGETPEFDDWQWVDFWHPLDVVIFFKRDVYQQVLNELGEILYPEGLPGKT
ncbi:MAG: RNA pyrophosphohydrolase [Gammaproteobacteria bacterium]